MHSLLDETERVWLDGLGVELSAAQRQALVVAWRTSTVTNAALRDLTGLDPIQARREIQNLRDRGLLEIQGERGGAYYVLGTPGPDAAPSAVPAPASPSRGMSGGDPEVVGHRPASVSTPDFGGLQTTESEASPNWGKLGADRDMALQRLPAELRAAVLGLGKRVPQAELRGIIARLCHWRRLTANELATLLAAHPNKLTERHLTPLVDAGVLARTRPGHPRHPDQAYRATQIQLLPAEEGAPHDDPHDDQAEDGEP